LTLLKTAAGRWLEVNVTGRLGGARLGTSSTNT
jgi:hypothetical protein